MRLERQLSDGSWKPCGEQTERFLLLCERESGLSREALLEALAEGKKVRNDPEDWYMQCRDGEVYEAREAARQAARKPAELVRCACGHTIPVHSVMTTSTGASCPDCYERMSVE